MTPAQHDNGKMARVFAVISLSIITIAAIIGLSLFAQRYLRHDILKVNTQPVKIQPGVIVPGGTLTYEFDYCKSRQVLSDITIDFQSDILSPAVGGIREFPIGCHKVYPKVAVPASIKPGEYELLIKIRYEEGGRTERHQLHSEKFQITANQAESNGQPQ